MITLPATTKDVGALLSQENVKQKDENRRMLLKIISSLRFLAQQSLALGGDGTEDDGNFMQLLKLDSAEDPAITEWLSKRMNKYTSHEVQNGLLKVMSTHILRDITAAVQKSPSW